MRREKFAANVADELDRHGYMIATSRQDKEAASTAIFDELHEWAAEKFPVGCGAEMSERSLRFGLGQVRNKIAHLSDEECRMTYGVPILLILSLIPTLVQWISMLWKWWSGE